ncbi:transcription initiation factor TFIID subunit 5-like [Durio zibethinus]|uniref:Transcription initiation factor TFIID subunit 5-like n=1 Tax=Durio zibethinus TaxID=66656 RepID=A0A6P6B9D1_DURZI|nr:transcription initiation factor TFIID subunit 5-like [Durio zibethinus]
MLSSYEGVNDVFFDSLDCLSLEEPLVAKRKLEGGKLEYEIWINEPRNVKERRESFLRVMDLVEFAKSSRVKDLERISEYSDAVPSSLFSSVNNGGGSMACCDRETTFQASFLVDESEQEQNVALERENMIFSPTEGREPKEAQAHLDECENAKVNTKKFKKWWKHLLSLRKGGENRCASKVSKQNIKVHKTNRMMVQPNKKGYMEFTALYMGPEIQAHKGFIWTMKFSPDGQYLASGGEDGVVRIWHVTSTHASSKPFMADGIMVRKMDKGKFGFSRKNPIPSPVIPCKNFQMEESPMQEFHGHASDVLDLAWSSTNCLVSSSMDKTVRLWQVGCNQCLNVFHHSNYVTCIQFNPIDDNYFISGSIDGKVRIWGVSDKRVVHWVDVRDIITAICYRPDGKEFVVGSITGTCHFYEASSNNFYLGGRDNIHGRKKTSGNKITSIQFFRGESHKVMITSEDSKLRIFDGVDIVRKFKGLLKSGSQMSASFNSTGRHIISVGEDCHVYVWNYNDLCLDTSKHAKSVHSCEHFFCKGVSVAIPWLGQGADQKHSDINGCGAPSPREGQEGASWIRDSERFSLVNWFSIDVSCKGFAKWPEEKLPLWDAAVVEDECYIHDQQQLCYNRCQLSDDLPETWGLVIVAGGWNGTIRTFQNHGLPVKL